ncbi:MAG: hypothetical protein DSY37_00990 [Hyperthermus sp.]|nr:MAG: hypothetical protein DSY37_00990 [Hyperthermus sp.]
MHITRVPKEMEKALTGSVVQEVFQPATRPLDLLVGMLYRLLPEKTYAKIASPRERSFIVMEQYRSEIPGMAGKQGHYCIYLMVKRGEASIDAARSIARRIGVAVQPLIYGLKDAEATTLQVVCMKCEPGQARPLVTVPGRVWARLLAKTAHCPSRNLMRGNCFIVILEALDNLEEVMQAIQYVFSARLPAYYAYQRFGTRRPNSHIIGKIMLINDRRSLLLELLDSDYPDESPMSIKCRRLLWVSEECSHTRLYERRIAEAILHGKNIDRSIPHHVKRIAVSALQAYIFNIYLSLRIREGYPLTKPLSGERLKGSRPLAWVPGIGEPLTLKDEAGELLARALEYAGLTASDLRNPPRLVPRVHGYWRPIYTQVTSPSLDMVDEGRLVARFCMERGMYASLVLREIGAW